MTQPPPGQGDFGPPPMPSQPPTPPQPRPLAMPDDVPPGPPQAYAYPPQHRPDYGFPQQAGGGAPLVTIGDITVLSDTIMTPAGPIPLRGAVWTVTDMSRTEQKTPTHAIVLAIIFFWFCLLGLLFLLMKEQTTVGHVQVTVNSGGRFHSTMVPVNSPQAAAEIMNRVNYARSRSM